MEAKTRARHRAFRNIALTFAVFTILLLGVVAYTAFSQAVITVHLNDVSKNENFRVTLAEESPDHPLPTSAIKATFLQVTDTAQDSFLPSQTGTPTGKAGGVVTLHNETARSQPLVATTRLLTSSGVLFRIKEGVRVPAHGTVDALAEADGTGPETEIGPSKFTIPGLNKALQASIYATSSAPMTRGAASVKTVSQQDLDQAHNTLKQRLLDKAKSDVINQVPTATVSSQDFVTSIVSEKDSAKVGDSVKSFTSSIKMNSVAVLFDRAAVRQEIAHQTQDNNISDSDQLTYTLTNYDPIAKTVTMTGSVSVKSVLDRTSSIFSPVNFVDMTPDQVKSFLENYEGIDSVNVQLSPYWQSRLPRIPSRIQVQFQ